MLKISKPIGANQAKKYYRDELKIERGTSLPGEASEKSLALESSVYSNGRWEGKLAEEMGLTGEIKTVDFERLCDGLHPHTGEQLVRHAPIKNYTNKFGKEITTMEHRACWDATFSAPKSVSLAAIAGGDERIREAHRESVRLGVSEIEKYTDARMGGSKAAERTGKFAAGLFEHETARPDQIFGYSAPQLHTHAVFFNVTETAKGLTKPIQPLEIYKTQKYATAVYRIELADRLRKLGYEIEIDPKTKAPEIKGFSQEYLKENSLRSQELNTLTDAVKLRFESAGNVITSDAGIKQVAAWQSRSSKSFDVEEMRSRALDLEIKYDFQAQRVYNRSLENPGYQIDLARDGQQAKASIDYAKQIFSPSADLPKDALQTSLPGPDNAIKINERQFLTEALENGTGKTTFAAVQREFAERSAAGEFSNLIKNENEITASRAPSPETLAKTGSDIARGNANALESSTAAHDVSARSLEDLKPAKELEKLSMDDLENAVRQNVAIENEAAQSIELLFF